MMHQANDAFGRRDLDAFLAIFDADVEFSSRAVEMQGGGPLRGHDGVRTWWDDVFAVFPDFRSEIEEVREFGDTTITRVSLHGQGTGSDVPVEQTQWILSQWRSAKAIRWHAFRSEAEALEAAGLSE